MPTLPRSTPPGYARADAHTIALPQAQVADGGIHRDGLADYCRRLGFGVHFVHEAEDFTDAPLPADGLRRHGRAGRAGAAEEDHCAVALHPRQIGMAARNYRPAHISQAVVGLGLNIELLVGMGRQDRHPPAGHKLLRPAVLLRGDGIEAESHQRRLRGAETALMAFSFNAV